MKLRSKALLFTSIFISAALTQAKEIQLTEISEKWDIKIGSYAMGKSLPWKGANTQMAILPGFDVSKGNWSFSLDTPVKYNFRLNPKITGYMALDDRNDGYDSDQFTFTSLNQHSVFDGYEKPDDEVILKLGFQFGMMKLEANHDISGNSDAQQLSASFNYSLFRWQQKLMLSLTPTIQYSNAHYVNYYYGVTAEQVNNTVGRNFYEGKSASNYQLAMNAKYKINPSWMLMMNVGYTKFSKSISDSPLVDTDHQKQASFILAYSL